MCVIWLRCGKLLISATENDAGRATIPSTPAPLREPARVSALKRVPQRIHRVGERRFRNLVGRELPSQRCRVRTLRRISQRFARPIKTAPIGRDDHNAAQASPPPARPAAPPATLSPP